MAPPRTQKRKSGVQPDEQDDGIIEDNTDASDRPNKRSKTSTSAKESSQSHSAGQLQLDADGNQYWAISRTRRVTISDFKGKRMVNIREYYEKDGKDLPGKKGISMTIEQYSALVDIMPQIENALWRMGEKVPRPTYGSTTEDVAAEDEKEQGQEGSETEARAERVRIKANSGKRKKANIEATSDEDD